MFQGDRSFPRCADQGAENGGTASAGGVATVTTFAWRHRRRCRLLLLLHKCRSREGHEGEGLCSNWNPGRHDLSWKADLLQHLPLSCLRSAAGTGADEFACIPNFSISYLSVDRVDIAGFRAFTRDTLI